MAGASENMKHPRNCSCRRLPTIFRFAAVGVALGVSGNTGSAFMTNPVARFPSRCVDRVTWTRPYLNRVSTRGLVGIKAVGDEGGVDANGSEGSSSRSLRSGLAKQEFITLVDEGNTEGSLKLLKERRDELELGMAEANKLLTLVSKGLFGDTPDENMIKDAYEALKDAGLLKAFGSVDLGMVPVKSRTMSRDKLEQMTGMNGQNLSPGRPSGLWLGAGVGLFAAELALGKLLDVDALQTIVPLTISALVADRILLGGAVAESCTRALVPGYRERIYRHEAGHFLVAYLLGCPVQGCLLDPFVVGRYSEAGTQGGMVFTDPVFSKGVDSGKLTRWAIDRFTTVLMGGIAAEAINYGSCEGGAADEGFMIQILSTISPPFSAEQIKSQAFWAATQAVLLIREHKEAYDMLVAALERGAELGECVEMIETELAKKPLPGDCNKDYRKPSSPAEEVRGMMVRRMSNRYNSYGAYAERVEERRPGGQGGGGAKGTVESERARLEGQMAEKDKAMLDLQRRVRELERTIAGGGSLDTQGIKEDGGGVWVNDLKALKEDISAASDNQAFEDAEMSDEGRSIAEASRGAATTARPLDARGRLSDGSASSAIAIESAKKLKDIETKALENAKRMADVEDRLRKFDDKQPR
ncbi:unnamed protein product [Ascophyllum nodosum]